MKRTNITIIALALACTGLIGCAQETEAQRVNAVYTEGAAVSQMESFVTAHAALGNTTPGPMETHCEMLEKLDAGEVNEFACATLVKEQNIVLEADCSYNIGCQATGYKVWDENTKKFVEPNPSMAEVAQ